MGCYKVTINAQIHWYYLLYCVLQSSLSIYLLQFVLIHSGHHDPAIHKCLVLGIGNDQYLVCNCFPLLSKIRVKQLLYLLGSTVVDR